MKKVHTLASSIHTFRLASQLGNVIAALADASKGGADALRHVPYRNSALTRLLQESLGGNCRTSLLVCISPALSDAAETKASLHFGGRAMRVATNAVINARTNFRELAEQLARRLERAEARWAAEREELIARAEV